MLQAVRTNLTSKEADANQRGKQNQTCRLLYGDPYEHDYVIQQTPGGKAPGTPVDDEARASGLPLDLFVYREWRYRGFPCPG